MKGGKNSLFISEHEWKRLKSQCNPPQACNNPEKDEYVKSLIEKSQNWIKSWPDSIESYKLKFEQQKQDKHAKDAAMVKIYKMEKKMARKRNVIEMAKQRIFDDSCYGRRLLSALLESKTLEERDIQLEFQKNLKQNIALPEQKDNVCSLQSAVDMEKQDKETVRCQRKRAKELAEINRQTYADQNEIKNREKEMQKQEAFDVLKLVKRCIENEGIEKANKQSILKQNLDLCIAERIKLKERTENRENAEERMAEIYRNYEMRVNCLTNKIHKQRFDAPQSTSNYELLKKLKNEENSRYDDFVNRGIMTLTSRLVNEENKEKQNRDIERQNNYLMAQSNKRLAEAKRLTETNINICTCDRQCIKTKCCKVPKIQIPIEQEHTKFTPNNTGLVTKLRMREKESSPWNSLHAAHEQFARQAGETLQQCRYKNMARKVVDDYRKLNCLDHKSMPVSNYL